MFDFKYSYDNFPKWEDECEGMEKIQGEMDNVRPQIMEPVVFATKDGMDLHILFVVPGTMEEGKKYPVIIYSKGSAWLQQNLPGPIGDFTPIVKQGYVLAVCEYRPGTTALYPAQVEDFKDAIRFVAQHSDEYQIDLNNIFLAGESSGGHTALMTYLTYNEGVLDSDSEEELPPIRGLMDFYGVTNIEQLAQMETGMAQEDNAELMTLFATPVEEYSQEGNFICYIDLREKLEPALIIHGNKDRLVPLSQSVDFYEALKKRHVDTRLIMVNDADHGGAALWGSNVINIILEFLNKNVA